MQVGRGEGTRTPTPLRAPHFECGAYRQNFATPPAPEYSESRRERKRFRDRTFAGETGDIRCVIHPAEDTQRFLLRVAKTPDRMVARMQRPAYGQVTPRACDLGHDRSKPRHERATGGHDLHVEALVHVAGVLRNVIAVRVRDDRAVSVDTATEEVREILVRDGERAQCEALRWCETDAREPVRYSLRSPHCSLQYTPPSRAPGRDRGPCRRQRRRVSSSSRSFDVIARCRPFRTRLPSVAISPTAYAISGDHIRRVATVLSVRRRQRTGSVPRDRVASRTARGAV